MSTIKDVARRTGLSLSTISKYLNGGSVREENRIAIQPDLSGAASFRAGARDRLCADRNRDGGGRF